mmetsp:Transcript_9687/g.24471  ORF Transcript_9687/g.24471 Transcript_9687/m.24471 type:complete len:232 (-) Transcript_9687:1749-2444(-)
MRSVPGKGECTQAGGHIDGCGGGRDGGGCTAQARRVFERRLSNSSQKDENASGKGIWRVIRVNLKTLSCLQIMLYWSSSTAAASLSFFLRRRRRFSPVGALAASTLSLTSPKPSFMPPPVATFGMPPKPILGDTTSGPAYAATWGSCSFAASGRDKSIWARAAAAAPSTSFDDLPSPPSPSSSSSNRGLADGEGAELPPSPVVAPLAPQSIDGDVERFTASSAATFSFVGC